MKYLIFLSLFVTSAWAKPLVLISYFDAFNRAPFNNSERIAKALEQRLNTEASPIEVKLCALNTIYDKAFAQTEDCLKAQTQAPVLVLGLGESTCELKIEAMMRNLDKTIGSPDNAGTHRNNTKIVQGAQDVIGLRYPLPQMYCALNDNEKNNLTVSNNAGSFVCNNTAYLMTHFYSEIQYGFIHVPANNCSNLAKKTQVAIESLEKMILKGADFLSTNEPERLPTTKAELKKLRKEVDEPCLNDYYKRLKGHDERRTIFSGLMN